MELHVSVADIYLEIPLLKFKSMNYSLHPNKHHPTVNVVNMLVIYIEQSEPLA